MCWDVFLLVWFALFGSLFVFLIVFVVIFFFSLALVCFVCLVWLLFLGFVLFWFVDGKQRHIGKQLLDFDR